MKKTFTSIALLALVALGTSTPAVAGTETAVESDVIVASATAVLTYDKPSVVTVAAPVIVKVPAKRHVVHTKPAVKKVPVKVEQRKKVPAQVVKEVQCYEDMPCWNCATMGNRICGPVNEPVITEPNPCIAPTLRAEDGSCVNPDFWK